MNADDRLRRLRDDDRWTDGAPPPAPTGSAQPPSRLHLSLVPVLATAVTAAVVGVIASAAVVSSYGAPASDGIASPSPSSSFVVVPWIATTPAPSPTSIVERGRVPSCVLSQLRIGSRPGGTAMGTWRAGVTLTNHSRNACTLGASNIALQARSAGRYVTFGQTTVETNAPGGFRLEPGKTAHFWGSLSPCYGFRHFNTEVLEPTYLVLGGERIRLDETVPNDFRPLCANPEGSSGPSTFNQEGDVLDPTSAYDGLKATMTVPASIRAGEVVDYTVTLSNPTARTISLTPCPTYDQYYVDPGDGKRDLLVVTHYLLNCTIVAVLNPGRSATFAMRTVIPEHAHGLAKISWSLDGDPSVTALRTIRTN